MSRQKTKIKIYVSVWIIYTLKNVTKIPFKKEKLDFMERQ